MTPFVFLSALLIVMGFAEISPCAVKSCSLLGEACDCFGQVCCDSLLNCTNGMCSGIPSVANNNQIQPFPSIFAVLSYSEVFVSCGRRFPSELYDAYSYPAGRIEPASNMPTRIFQSCVEIASPPPCCAACTVDGVCSTSGGCICDPTFFNNANCSIGGADPGSQSCAGTSTSSLTTTLATTTPSETSTDLSLVKDDCQDTVQPNALYSFSFTITNLGSSDSENVVLLDNFPSMYSIQSADSPCIILASNSISCKWNRISSQASAIVRVSYVVRAGGGVQNVTNCATISSATHDPNSKNNEDCDTNLLKSCVSYNLPCISVSDCCSPLQCLRHSSLCSSDGRVLSDGRPETSYRCAIRGGFQLH
jgi:hypothetical protein